MPMIVRSACLPSGPASGADSVCIVVPDQTLAVRSVQGERVTDPVRSLWRGGDLLDDHLDPVRAVRIDDENDVIEREESLQSRIMFWFCHSPAGYHEMITLASELYTPRPVDVERSYVINVGYHIHLELKLYITNS